MPYTIFSQSSKDPRPYGALLSPPSLSEREKNPLRKYTFFRREDSDGRRKGRNEKWYTRKTRQARVDNLMEIAYDRVKTESHISTLNPPTMIQRRAISCRRPVYTVLYTQGPINLNSTKLNKAFHKGGITYVHSHHRGFRSLQSMMPRITSLSNRLQ